MKAAEGSGPTRRIGVWGTRPRWLTLIPAVRSFFAQHLYMRQDTLRKPIEPVTTLQDRHQATLAEFVSKPDYDARDGRETSGGNIEHAEQVVAHAVKAGADENEIGLEVSRRGNEPGLKSFQDL